MTIDTNPPKGIHVAIIGGGITGVILALGLSARNVSYTLYERGTRFTELGAGIGISPNAERALACIDPEVYRVYKSVATSTGNEEDYFNWVDGRHTNLEIGRLLIGIDAFQGGRRSDFLEAWARLLPGGRVSFGKQIDTVRTGEGGRMRMRFRDDSVEWADVVIGCDGIHSRTRQLILGQSNPASYAQYTQQYCFRALLPMSRALAVAGQTRTARRYMYNGPGAHALTYPVAGGRLLNALFKHTAKGSRAEVAAAFKDWHPTVQGLVALLPEYLDKWAIFDMHENPAPYYNLGAIALAGDAAHAAGPHLGSGAGFGIEDALVLANVLRAADEEVKALGMESAQICAAALNVYNNIRYSRTQWLPGATREAVDLFQWRDPSAGKDADKFLARVSELYHTIWDYDVDEMVETAVEEFRTAVAVEAAD
ncbi:hypothetical protein F4777DRAFT_587056 [Nemania sp. FL0916]|nr:hypothetical protein F4777DRAFT_587056 [Nemania sp. FL0916]